jgi:hypothetical protein
MPVRALAGVAILGSPMLAMSELNKAVDTLPGLQNDVTTVTTVAAIWTALRNVFFASKSHTPVATATGL